MGVAQAIEQAFRTHDGENFRVVFVLTLEDGRCKPDDLATINLVLSAVPAIGGNYGIIINKASPRVKRELEEDGRKLEELRNTMFCHGADSILPTDKLFFLQNDLQLYDEDDALMQDPSRISALLDFVDSLQPIRIRTVGDIQSAKYDELKAKHHDAMALIVQLQAEISQMREAMESSGELKSGAMARLRAQLNAQEKQTQAANAEKLAQQERIQRLEDNNELATLCSLAQVRPAYKVGDQVLARGTYFWKSGDPCRGPVAWWNDRDPYVYAGMTGSIVAPSRMGHQNAEVMVDWESKSASCIGGEYHIQFSGNTCSTPLHWIKKK